jgi:glycosyltransferase involved in cell wall biosynthesis
MPDNPLISILMITYNHEKYIAQAIESVLMQQVNFKYEIVIGEDCSTDRTKDIVVDYQEKYRDRIKLLLQAKNAGMHRNFIDTYYSCRGKYIALLEGDDYWTDPHKLQKQVEFLEKNPDFAICFHNMQIIYEDEPHRNRLSNINQQEITTIENLAYGNYIYTASCVFRKYLSEIPDWFYQCPVGDYPLHLLNAQYGKIKFIDEVMGIYRVHKGGIWENKSWSYRCEKWVELLENIKNKFDKNINQIIHNRLHDYNSELAEYYLNNRDYEKSKLYLKKIGSYNQNYLFDVIEKINEEKYESIRKIQDSYSYKLGNIILKPLRIVKEAVFRRKRLRSLVKYGVRVINTFAYQVRDIFLPNGKLKKSGMNNGKVSIIIPTLSKDSQADHLLKLKQLLSEFLPNQKYNNYEALVYCDGPNPLVENMVSLLGDNRIKVYATDHTIGKWGHPQTRMGIDAATGVFFVRMNDDNKPYNNYLQTLVSSYDDGVGITYGRVVYKGEARKAHDRSLVHSFVIPGDRKGLLRRANIDCMNYMVKMELAKKYMDYWENSYGADWLFLEALLKNDIKAKFIDSIIGEKL